MDKGEQWNSITTTILRLIVYIIKKEKEFIITDYEDQRAGD